MARSTSTAAETSTQASTQGSTRTPAHHVVFGAGAVGLALTGELVARGVRPQDIRVVNRSGRAPVPAGVQTLAGDARDPAFAIRAATGARVVHQVLNPPYHRWAQEFPALQDGVLAAAEAAGARLVTLENVYAYGAPAIGPDGATTPFTEDSPLRPSSRKGAVRARMHTDLMAAHDAGRVEVAVARASDYFGPRGGLQALNLGDQAMRAALTGGKAQVVGDPDQPHTYTYIPDIAAALATLGDHPDAPGHVWHVPNDPATRTVRELLDTVFRLAGHRQGRDGARVQRVSTAMLRSIGVVKPAAREVVEMLYEFDRPFLVDSSRITDKLGLRHTPLDQALAATLDTYR